MLRFSQFGLIPVFSLLIICLAWQSSPAQSAIPAAAEIDLDSVFADFYTIEELYDSAAAELVSDGVSLKVYGQFVDPEVSILVSSFAEYLKDQLMPPNSSIIVDGLLPDAIYNNGGTIIIDGSILIGVNPNLRDVTDTLLITIFPTSFEYVLPGWPDSILQGPEPGPEGSYREPDAVDCDSCKFAILVSSMGTRGAHGGAAKPTYWENIVNLRRHKIDNEGYCENNIFVHFADGTSDAEADIPSDQVEPCTEAAIGATHDEIARRIAACKRDSTDSKVQKMFTNHGADDAGVVLWRPAGDVNVDHRYLSPEELTEMQQKLIDSCCTTLIDEFITCFGGDMLNGLEDLDNKSKTQIHANSAAPDYAVGWSPSRGGHAYLNKKIDCLSDTTRNYEECVREAEKAYLEELEEIKDELVQDTLDALAEIARIEGIMDEIQEAYDAGDMSWAEYNELMRRAARLIARQVALLVELRVDIANLKKQLEGDADGNGQGCPSWVRHSYHKYCEWKEFVAEPGGQLAVDFTGPPPSTEGVGCGNVTIWEKMSDGTYRRVRQWNWNLPGGLGYVPGAERRVLHVPLTGTGVYFIHNDDGEYTIDVHSLSGRPDTNEDPSNDFLAAGFSLGGIDGSLAEFGGIYTDAHASAGTNLDGFNLSDVPACISAFEGVGVYSAGFSAEATNQYWDDMEVVINVLDVGQSGTFEVTCLAAENQLTTLFIEGPGEYRIHLGAVSLGDISGASIEFATSFTGASFCWDAWSLRSLVSKYGDILLCCGLYTDGYTGNTNCDDEGKRNLADITRLIDRVYISKVGLCCEDSGNVDGDTQNKTNLADITKLIDHVYISKAETAACE